MTIKGLETIYLNSPVYGAEDEYGESDVTSINSTPIHGALIAEAAGDLSYSTTTQEKVKQVYSVYVPRGAWLSSLVPESTFTVRGGRFVLSEPARVWQAPGGFTLVKPRVILNLVSVEGSA